LPDLLIISEGYDSLANRFFCHAKSNGWSVESWGYTDACLKFQIARHGTLTQVEPIVPVLLRLPTPNSPWMDDESQFHRAEKCSFVWAATALSEACVINRPNAYGFSGRCALSTAVTKFRAGLSVAVPETFASHMPDPIGPADEWWLEQQADRRIISWQEGAASSGPFRAARVRAGFILKTFIVVGERSFVEMQSNSDNDLATSSVKICRALGIAFAAVTWRWHSNECLAELGRVNPHPTVQDVGECWEEVAKQILLELSK
jgi:hypothetical protein